MAFMSQLLPLSDSIHLTGIPSTLSIGLDAWSRPAKPQPITISLQISHSVSSAASRDDVSLTLDYGKLYKRLTGELEILNSNYSNDITLQGVINIIDAAISSSSTSSSASQSPAPAPPCIITVSLPKAVLRCLSGITYSAIRVAPGSSLYAAGLEIKRIDCACIVGVNPHERREKQSVYVSLEFRTRVPSSSSTTHRHRHHHHHHRHQTSDQEIPPAGEAEEDEEEEHLPNSTFCTYADFFHVLTSYQSLVREVCDLVDGSAFETLEALATHIARYVTMRYFSPSSPSSSPSSPALQPHVTTAAAAPPSPTARKSVSFSDSANPTPSPVPVPITSSPPAAAATRFTPATAALSPVPLPLSSSSSSSPRPQQAQLQPPSQMQTALATATSPPTGLRQRKPKPRGGSSAVTVTLEKPSAIAMIEAAGVRITRTRRAFEDVGNPAVGGGDGEGGGGRRVMKG